MKKGTQDLVGLKSVSGDTSPHFQSLLTVNKEEQLIFFFDWWLLLG